MDFNDSPKEAEFRSDVRRWLAANAPLSRTRTSHGHEDSKFIVEEKAWQAKKADAGYACLTWPREWGGAGRTPAESIIFHEEESKLDVATAIFRLGLDMCVPTIMIAGNEADKIRFAKPAMRGEEIWCQLFSEPSAGSDLAASRTRAVQTDEGSEDWIINGQKVWTSGAHIADFGLLIARTDPEVPKHKGLTMFWVDMKAPGIEVRPIRQADGGSGFNEVYFSDVRLKDSQRIGEVGKGWNVALITLMHERLSVGTGSGPSWQALMELIGSLPGVEGKGSALKDGGFREKFTDWYVAAQGLQLTRRRTQTALSRGETPGPEASIGKIIAARQMQELATEALDRLDQYGIVANMDAASLIGGFQRNFFWGSAMRIAGGTDEILKNILAERVLGLPLDIRVDRDVEFRNIPGSI
ncbi:acyl-CoA dehydrogenase domain protein [Parvibaculum lavamentivorans DS-1]|uniref:Acyl-CoA dehydrogenase domain protein n=1 Tax=Parvibaculum lavamentivorans (strain DS-1 / DSM 13023 / NCIMB 13966) TaxID=402881 RepID=A7HRX1_PARL1|nr:acyl-CoA dehydrogenase family protein [Parvibaculum lavamentivorans]ABS62654.1 acyl-CoA dehydrogenase domain protein [Parvibaculum lavamentivorans DS-1]